MINDQSYMKLALDLAENTEGQTSPNPVVGAVVVKEGRILGMGAHLKAGTEHAEVHALAMAGDEAAGADIYVTLEPCSHYGKTPPCADTIINKGIKRAVIATSDPNPQVAGKGIQKLKEAGVEVVLEVEKERADWLNRKFFHFMKAKTPYVTLKSATSLDGKTATVTGESQWITEKEAREDVHYSRHTHDAILAGVETVKKDNPSLTTRLPSGGAHPIRVILDTNLRTPLQAKMLHDGLAPVWIICGSDNDEQKVKQYKSLGAEVIKMSHSSISLQEMLNVLGERNIQSLYVEGGATVAGSFVKERAFQEVIMYMAPKLIGGKDAPTAVGGTGIANINEAIALDIISVEKAGDDLKITARPKEAF
ncbi:bifunctional diaminohydroxyphosphoribosylaminopyrimidine deaminase/5-amino-6-(5-phosphoribosylamino)uracil reductase RibD [Thalassorhabdus alkalitolerans]|uniref:Riboflavin biosynthesis protein RibD n=1 Tax=Thalassorhabdus alkalitolerans TaxID=2282697 RepID=A0ABW0YRY1_9BACI